MNTKHPEMIGVCLDTCHIFAGHDIRSVEGFNAVMI